MSRLAAALVLFLLCLPACNPPPPSSQGIPQGESVVPKKALVIHAGKPVPDMPGERFFKNVRKLTSGGENAEAYWSNDGTKLVFQRRLRPTECDQIYLLDLGTQEPARLVSTGKGVTTCSYFTLDDKHIIYASTHLFDAKCPPPVARHKGRYVWAVREGFDLFLCDLDGSNLKRLTDTPGYDAEATVCPVTGRVLFTSARDGDLELYSMEQNGSDLKRLTNRIGYDGGGFFSHDGSKIVYRSALFGSKEEAAESVEFLKNHVVVPSRLEIMVMDRDGKNPRQITKNGKANFAPYFTPDDKAILFSSNQDDSKGRNFEIYKVGVDGEGLVKVTENPSFDGFPMFSPNGKYIVFASNRFGDAEGETNIFLAEWVQ